MVTEPLTTTPNPRKFLLARQVSETTGLTLKRVRWLIDQELLPSVKWGSRTYVAANAVERLIQQVAGELSPPTT